MKAEDINEPGGAGELDYLRKRAAAAKVVLEIGCWHGRSTYAMCAVCPGVVHAIDNWRGQTEESAEPCWKDRSNIDRAKASFFQNLKPFLDSGKLIFHEGVSWEVARTLPLRWGVDFAFIDGSHDYRSVHEDILAVLPLMRWRGIMSGHDLQIDDVKRAVSKLLDRWHPAEGYPLVWEAQF